MAWQIEVVDECAVVRMNTNEVNVQNEQFFADSHAAFDRLEQEFNELPVVLTGHGDAFSAGIDFQYSFDIFGKAPALPVVLVDKRRPGPAGGMLTSHFPTLVLERLEPEPVLTL